jgi:hypothetical protein
MWISIRPPSRKYHLLWLVMFVLLGGSAATTTLLQIREARRSDEATKTSAQISERALQDTICGLRTQVKELSEKSIPTLIGDVNGLKPHKAVPANLTLRFVHPDEVAIVVDNAPHAGLADRPKYYAMLADLDNVSDFLRIPTFMGDYIRPGEFMGPNQFMGLDTVKALIKPGDRIFGSVGVSCPTCIKSRNYWLYIKVGAGGWYEEQEGPPKGLSSINAAKVIGANFDAYADIIAPNAKRITIKQTIDSPK